MQRAPRYVPLGVSRIPLSGKSAMGIHTVRLALQAATQQPEPVKSSGGKEEKRAPVDDSSLNVDDFNPVVLGRKSRCMRSCMLPDGGMHATLLSNLEAAPCEYLPVHEHAAGLVDPSL